MPKLKVEIPALTVSKSLDLLTSLNVGAIFSISYPRIYALPGLTCSSNKLELAVLPSSVVAPAVNTPTFSFTVTHSFPANWNGRTV